MSVFNRIAQIENKIGSLEARLNGATPSPTVGAKGEAGLASAQQFAGVMDSISGRQHFTPTVSGLSGSSAGAKGLDSASVQPYVKEAAAAHGVDPALIEAVIKQESSYRTDAESSCGAQGLMQLMPETAKELGVSNSLDPRSNVMGGTKYLSQLLKRFDGNMTMAIAAYNAGPGAVEKYGGVPPYAETQDYVQKVLNNYQQFKG